MALVQYAHNEAGQVTPGDQRVFTRVPYARSVSWRGTDGDLCAASVRNVSRTGVGLQLGRFLPPGRVIRITFDGIEHNGLPIDLTAMAIWCRPETSASQRFVAGFAIMDGDRSTLAAMSEVFYAAIHQYAKTLSLR